MEFVLISSPELQGGTQSLGPMLSEVALRDATQPTLKFYAFDGLFLASNEMMADDVSAIGFDGSAIDNNRAYNSTLQRSPAHAQLANYLDSTMDSENTSALRGNFCAVRLNPHTRAFNIATDPMSAYPIVICGFGDTLIVSNNVELLVTSVTAFGLSLTRSSKALVMGLALGVTTGNRTGFREVAKLPPGKLITGLGPNWRIIDQAPPALPQSSDSKTFVSALCERLDHNLSACKQMLDETTTIHTSAHSDLLPALGTNHNAPTTPADDAEQRWRIKHAIGSALLTDDCLLRPYGSPTLSALFDFSMLGAGKHAKSRSLFWKTPLKSMIAFSNSDPLLFAALSAKYKRGHSTVATLALRMARRRTLAQSVVRRSFLRQSMELLMDELHKQSSPATGHAASVVNSALFRQEAMILAADNHKAPVFAPFLDPWLSASAWRRTGLELETPAVLRSIIKTMSKQTPKPPAITRPSSSELRMEALNACQSLSARAECWTYLDRRKTLNMLQSESQAAETTQVHSDLLQVLRWAAG